MDKIIFVQEKIKIVLNKIFFGLDKKIRLMKDEALDGRYTNCTMKLMNLVETTQNILHYNSFSRL